MKWKRPSRQRKWRKRRRLGLHGLGWIWVLLLMTISIGVPFLIVQHTDPFEQGKTGIQGKQAKEAVTEMVLIEEDRDPEVTVYVTKQKRIDTLSLERYVRGVVAAEMPISFQLEAMKAQAIAARTYIIRRLHHQDNSQVPVEGAIVTDTVWHQAFVSEEELKQRWGTQYTAHMNKLTRAVNETRGWIATYEDQPIEAAFFSTSNGYTENAEDYWSQAVPYLKSVASPWDVDISPKYEQQLSLPYEEVREKLGLPLTQRGGVAAPDYQVLSETAGHRIREIRIEGKTFTAREVREQLGLPSTDFEWKNDQNHVQITSFGYGHGIGMSQYGAEGMARAGKSAEEILKYYYQGTELQKF
ncbi:stage II sporulation protein D [Marinicrinis sediminis]|uniref:Stage II sporulation protein D n=1 Tax=Marinicrinis sediminis TaxID=1652465 RepID=A0ABW5RBE1_9BACL